MSWSLESVLVNGGGRDLDNCIKQWAAYCASQSTSFESAIFNRASIFLFFCLVRCSMVALNNAGQNEQGKFDEE